MHAFTLSAITENDVRTGDRERYLQLVALLEAELQPEGALEVLHAAEIVRANWRLQIYAHFEETADNEAGRTSLDRARSHANTIIRRNTAELRRLQTERLAKSELGLELPRMVGLKEYFHLTKQQEKRKDEPNPPSADVAEMQKQLLNVILADEKAQMPEEMKKRTQARSRNESCQCGSGVKFKRCCGHWSKAA